MNKKILITLAAGRTGFATASLLLDKGYSVRAFVRSENDKAEELVRRGAEVVPGTFDDKEAIRRALTGVHSVYYCYPYKTGLVRDVALFIQVAREAGVQAVVFMGQRIAEFSDTGSGLTNDIRKAYSLLEQSGLNVVYFCPGYFADNVFVVSEQVLQLGILPNMFKKGKNPWLSTADMARCIASLLINPEPYYGERLYPTGPASISSREIASIFSKVSGRRIRMLNIPEWLFLKAGIMGGREYGFDTYAIVQGTYYNRQMQMNRFDMVPTDVVKMLTGAEPEDFETITREYFSRSRYHKRTFFSVIRAFFRFSILPFVPVPGRSARKRINGE